MQISKLKTLPDPNLNDVIPILDINGGIGGKPILRKAALSSLLALLEVDNNSQPSSNFVIPTTIKNVAASGDFFIGIDADGLLYKISKVDLLAGLSSGDATPKVIKTQLLLHGESIIDSSLFSRPLVLNGNPTISTSVFKFGNSSIYFNGFSSIETPNTNDLIVGSRDFCVEAFVKLESYPSEYGVIVNSFVSGNQRWTFYFGNNVFNESGLVFTDGTSNISQASSITSLSALGWDLNTMYYVALKRENGIVSLWRDSLKLAEGTNATNFSHTGVTRIGEYTPQFPFRFQGYIDELRITCPGVTNVSIIPSVPFPNN
jgi:hypothetical protein